MKHPPGLKGFLLAMGLLLGLLLVATGLGLAAYLALSARLDLPGWSVLVFALLVLVPVAVRRTARRPVRPEMRKVFRTQRRNLVSVPCPVNCLGERERARAKTRRAMRKRSLPCQKSIHASGARSLRRRPTIPTPRRARPARRARATW